MKRYNDVIEFWFHTLSQSDWWKKSDALDITIREQFLTTHSAAVRGECHAWRDTPHGRLAEIIVIDQFSRNMFRDKKEAFAFDPIAVVLTQEAVRQEVDQQLDSNEKIFLYMPLMHSESLKIHELAVKFFNQPGLESNLRFEHKHKVIIEQFGRYPHRNDILGRESTDAELEFLRGPNSSF